MITMMWLLVFLMVLDVLVQTVSISQETIVDKTSFFDIFLSKFQVNYQPYLNSETQ